MEMSEKAKGKRRADERYNEQINEPGSSSTVIDMSIPRTVIIRFTEGVPDLLISVLKKETVREVKRKIRLERAALANRRLRLIHSGRLLTDGTFLYDWLETLEERQRRSKGDTSENVRNGDNSSTWLHCSIGPEMSGIEEEESVQKSQLTPLRGFDRLTTAGFTEDDIVTIRRQFHASRGLNEPDPVDDDENEHARALEEQWIDEMDAGAGIDHVDGAEGLYTTLLQGVSMGFFFGLIPFFFMRHVRPAAFFSDAYDQIDHTPSVVFSKRMQMALVIGLIVNILFGILRYIS